MNPHVAVLLDQPADRRSRLSGRLGAGLLRAPYTTTAVRSGLGAGTTEEIDAVCDALAALDRGGITGQAIALTLDTARWVAADVPRADLVWSGPEGQGLRARDTRPVYEELISSARESVWLCTYAYWEGAHAFASLARRMDAVPELTVSILLNIGRRYGDTTPGEELVRRFAARFWDRDWPGARRPAVFYDPRSVALEPEAKGVLHAKAVVVDERSALVTSANLTEAAFDRNIEVGVLSQDARLAGSLARHFRVLIDRRLLVPLVVG